MEFDLLRRVRWRNLGRAAAAVALVGAVVAWPRLTPPEPQLPGSEVKGDVGSIIIVVATDAPLLPHQLKRIARRASLGLARTGSVSGNGSGDIFIAFSTANPHADDSPGPNAVQTVSTERISPLFEATVEATEEAIVNAMVGAKTITGINGHTVVAVPHQKVQQVVKKHNR